MNKYKTILSVCETHSLSRTAALLNYTQSAVSQTIKNFEKELGLEIFIRSKNGMELKSDMTWILESLRAICDAENEIERTAASLVNLDSGLIRKVRSRVSPTTGFRVSSKIFPRNIPTSAFSSPLEDLAN